MRSRCQGCGWEGSAAVDRVRCPNSGDGGEHVLARVLPARTTWPADDHPNPFVRYRTRLASHAWAASDAEHVRVVERLDAAVAAVEGDGEGFRVTPLRWVPALGALVKDETGNVAGSHKGRHLMGLAIGLEVAEVPRDRPLAIASCGNAALAAAVVARAAGRPLDVYVPPWADPAVVARLRDLGARIQVCPRRDEDPPGDPCHHRVVEAVAAGAYPFGCQGPDNGHTLDGGRTLGYELADAGVALGAVVVQVGGGALGASLAEGLAEAHAAGVLATSPVVHTVQAQGCHPLERAWRRRTRLGLHDDELANPRSRLMWPWEDEPHSLATGILDDETYDWLALLRAMARTGGGPVVVGEDELVAANRLGREATDIDVDVTGTAGLAGLLALRAAGVLAAAGEGGDAAPPCVLFTGRRR